MMAVDADLMTPIIFAEQIVQDYEARLIRQRRVLAEADVSAHPEAKATAELLLTALQHFSDLAVQRLARLKAEEQAIRPCFSIAA
jgi:hypothetical protein